MAIIAREKYHHEEHEGHKVKSGYEILCDFPGEVGAAQFRCLAG